jgi:hypothetical protein
MRWTPANLVALPAQGTRAHCVITCLLMYAAGKAPAAKKAATGSGAKPKAKPAAKKGGAKAPKRVGENDNGLVGDLGLGFSQAGWCVTGP